LTLSPARIAAVGPVQHCLLTRSRSIDGSGSPSNSTRRRRPLAAVFLEELEVCARIALSGVLGAFGSSTAFRDGIDGDTHAPVR
jgi:hypothetical protein